MQNELNENPNKFNGGTFFVVFDNMKMKDTFCNFSPNSYFNKIMWSIRYFFGNVICGKWMNKGRKDISRLKLSIDFVGNSELYEVESENLGYTRSERNMRL